MATTTNFGWETPDDTDLVKDGALAMRTLGNAIDTSLVDLKGGTTGQVLSKTSNTDMDFTWVAQDDSNAIQNAIVDAKGDLISATAADTPARLAVGTNGQVLAANSSTSTGLEWQNPNGWTLISTTTLSGATTTINTSSGYKQLVLWVTSHYPNADASVTFRLNGDSGSNYSFIRDTFTAPNSLASIAEIISNFGLGDNYKGSSNTNTLVFTLDNPDSTTMHKVCNLWQRYMNSGNVQTTVNHRATYLSTSAITSIVLGAGSSTWAGGTALLYGVK